MPEFKPDYCDQHIYDAKNNRIQIPQHLWDTLYAKPSKPASQSVNALTQVIRTSLPIVGLQETSANIAGAVGSMLALLGNPLPADDAYLLAAEAA